MNGIMQAIGQISAHVGEVRNAKTAGSRRTAPNAHAEPAYKVEMSEDAIKKAKEFIEQLCKEKGIDPATFDGPFDSLHAEEAARPKPNAGKVTTAVDLSRRDIKRVLEYLLKKSEESGGIVESDMLDPLIFQLNVYNGYHGDFGFFDEMLKYLQDKDPDGTNHVISKMKDLFKQAQTGEYIFTKHDRRQMDQRIENVKNQISNTQSKIKALQKQLEKLNENVLAINKESLPNEEKQRKTKPLEKQINAIQEQLSKLFSQQKDLSIHLAEVSTAPKLR